LEICCVQRCGQIGSLGGVLTGFMSESLGAGDNRPKALLDLGLHVHRCRAGRGRRSQSVAVPPKQAFQLQPSVTSLIIAAKQPLNQIEELLVVCDFAKQVVQIPAIEAVRGRGQQQYGWSSHASSHHLLSDVGATIAADHQILEALEFIENHQIGRKLIESSLGQSNAQEIDGPERTLCEFPSDSGRQGRARCQSKLLA